MLKPKPKNFTQEQVAIFNKASSEQTVGGGIIKTVDPNFPVFDIPVNQKVLIYIPNHREIGANGEVKLRADRFNAHPVIEGANYRNIRCTSGIIIPSDEFKYDGTCPLCEGTAPCWDLYKYKYNDIAKSRGINPATDDGNELLKNDRIKLSQARVIKSAEAWLTFPIVVITCEEKDGQMTTTPKLTADGKLQGKPMWYCVRQKTFEDKWESAFDSLDDVDGDGTAYPAGLWAILNFTYTSKSGKYDKMNSAKNLKVTYRLLHDRYAQWENYFDQLTADWTPDKAKETVVLDFCYDVDELKEIADNVLAPVRNSLQMYALSDSLGVTPNATAPAVNTDATAVLDNFNGVSAAPPVIANIPSGFGVTQE